jgi:hypothetical protein
MYKYKRWIKYFFRGSILFFGIIVSFNYFVDSFNLFHNSKSSMAKDLQNSFYISGAYVSTNRVDNIYEPLIQSIKKSDVLVIGSSRSMKLHKELLYADKNISFYNFTDGTANLNHYAKILGLFNKYNKKFPDTIILGIDPWVFDEKVSLTRIKKLLESGKNSLKSKYMQLFNFEYTKINVQTLFMPKYKKSKKLSDLLTLNNKNPIISPHGDLYTPLYRNDISKEKLLSDIQIGLQKCDETNYNTKCVKYEKLHNFTVLKYILDYLKQHKVNVVIYLSPFEPTFYKHIVKYNNFKIYEKMIEAFLIDNNVKIVGSYDPKDYDLKSIDFTDGIHPKESVIKKIFE